MDGVYKNQDVLITKVPVNINKRTVLTTFMVLPELRDNRTLLGVGFIQDAHIILNLPQCTWYFMENPEETFELYEESFIKFKSSVDFASIRNENHAVTLIPRS